MRSTWHSDRRAFYEHRRAELAWGSCPDSIRQASEAYDVDAALLYGIEGAESTWGAGGSNLFGLLAGAEGVSTSDPYAAAMQASRLMRRLHDQLGSWEAAMRAYSGGGYGLSHPYSLAGDTCP